jgi:hypothetical protein
MTEQQIVAWLVEQHALRTQSQQQVTLLKRNESKS